MRLLLSSSVLVCLAACRSGTVDSTQPPTDPSADRQEATAPAQSPEHKPSEQANPVEEPPPVYRLAWGVPTGEWNSAVAVASDGWVVSAGSRKLFVHASDDGRTLESTVICSVADNGIALLSDTTGGMVCRDGEIRALTFPGVAQKPVAKVSARIEAVGWSDGHLVTGNDSGTVTILETKTWTVVDTFQMSDEIEGAAVAPDGSWAAASDDSGLLVIRDLATKTTREFPTTRRSHALQASPDSTRLFAANGFEARVYDVKTGAITSAHKAGPWLNGARWLRHDLVAATGSDGFMLYPRGAAEPDPLIDPDAREYRAGEWIGASPDGSIVCGGDRAGQLSCFSTKPMPASTYAPAVAAKQTGEAWGGGTAPAAGPSAGDPPEPSAPEFSFVGVIKSRKGKKLSVTATSEELPEVGLRASLSRRFERKMGRLTMEGWMGIAKVEVTAVEGSTIELKILEETSNVVINGRKQKQFKTGFEVKLGPEE